VFGGFQSSLFIYFNVVNFPFLDGDVPRATSYRVFISQLVCFARACNDANDFNELHLCITEKLLKQGYRYHKGKPFASFIADTQI
jgi:hypothetical protein